MSAQIERAGGEKQLGEKGTPVQWVRGRSFRDPVAPLVFGLIGTVVVHLALVLLAPKQFSREIDPAEREPVESVELFLEEAEPEPPEDEFIMTNPDAFSNPPDETRFFSDRDQQAAQEEESETGDPSLPAVEGEESEPTQNIIEQETMPFTEEELLEEMAGDRGDELAFDPLPERLIPGFEEVDEEEGLEVPVTPETDREIEDEPVIGVDLGAGEDDEEAAEGEAPGEERVMPRPRPRLPQTSGGPVGRREGAAPRVGTIAVDANFSDYGDYLARMLDAIVRQWHLLAWDSLQAGEVGTLVVVTFKVDSGGEIHELNVQDSTAGLTATLICKDAISSRQPYGEWTPDMKEVLGEEQTVRIRFLYR